MTKIAIIGAGAWGTALAQTLTRSGLSPTLWARDPEQVQEIQEKKTNNRKLSGVRLSGQINATRHAGDLQGTAIMLLAIPTQALRDTLENHPFDAPILVSCAKGLERHSGLRPSQVIKSCRPNAHVAAISGPSFAGEVAIGLPTALSIAATNLVAAQKIADQLRHEQFRLYPSDDLIGVEYGGALKNVIAIASGAVMGKGLGENARAALIARGLAEVARLAIAEGAVSETLMGLSGLGDILLTATSLTSRNTKLGYDLAQGSTLSNSLAEGRHTAAAAIDLAKKKGIEMPIAQAVSEVLAGTRSLAQAIRSLLDRPLPEVEWSSRARP